MIKELQQRKLLSIVQSQNGLIGYRFTDSLCDAAEFLDETLLQVLCEGISVTPHSCTTLLPRSTLERINFFDKLPSNPLHVYPHLNNDVMSEKTGDAWVLSPSTCYHTFSHLTDSTHDWELKYFTAKGQCHRYEPAKDEPTRMGNFTMRELVLVGLQEKVETHCEMIFGQAVKFLRLLSPALSVEKASDVFYGEHSKVTRKVQLSMGVKCEVLIPWFDKYRVSVGSRNLHRDLFTTNFNIISSTCDRPLHSACIAFGMERLLLALLAHTLNYDPCLLIENIEKAASLMSGPLFINQSIVPR
ncbi:hypothetical protein LGZ99_15080 [Photorhabdus temperata]|uniref:Aminoacyl-transfer RNA synthetases class-II family profile domain-containing protein n=2 Tax=Photorhabdus temperata TaxID=574560 RepID=A0A081RYF5_PHOTE|nr:hypothetical protein [Photorhabdus temperata]EQB99732.1 hypothetical protein B738_15881 [Photorhabdus temperata subsp. temperata M1021]ERT11756.1 hypothetical protein O185_17860 [Photorhabdus temperata J3]KER03708.1 hypothetical protein MEG1DRAFT_01632 [Photorhabdus temperata subsp. temperata Meg1]MCT8348489.1 hypothetical protein [Photorhabdus temperata]